MLVTEAHRKFFYQGNDREKKPQRRKLLASAVGGKSFHSSTPLLCRAWGVLEKLSSVLGSPPSPEETVLTDASQ